MIPMSVLIGFFVAIVGYWLQQRAWRNRTYEETRQREFEECLKLVEDIAAAIDKRLVSLATFQRLLDANEIDEESLKDYREGIKDWMHSFSSFKARIYHYFGRDQMLTFENDVHAKLRTASDIFLRTHRYGKANLSKLHRKEQDEAFALLNLARYEAFSFLRELNERISNGEVGRTSMYNNIEIGNLDLISRTFLIQRLLGLKSR